MNNATALDGLPIYKSSATPKERDEKINFMSFQLKMIKEQVGLGIAADKTTVKCGCQKKIKVLYSHRCLYCGIYYCRECAQEHFGYRIA